MTITLTDNEYRMLQNLTTKGLQEISRKVRDYSENPNLPTVFRNRCNEELESYRSFVNKLTF